jgi:sugar phosphate isomerase/epimerase
MTTRIDEGLVINRRGFLSCAAAAAAATLLSRHTAGAADAPSSKPNSVIDGVKIGCITYSYRGGLGNGKPITTAEDTLKALITDGLSEVEMMPDPILSYAGITRGAGRGRGGARGAGAAQGQPAQPAAPLSDAERTKQRETQLAKCREMRKMYNDAGVNIHIHKIPFGQSDEEIDFNFEIAKALGCVAITTERNDTLPKKLAPFAEKHKIYVAFHNHVTNFPSIDQPDPLLDVGKYIAFNLDIGHYYAGTKGKSPIPVIEKYHDRIISLHLKDRTADGRNLTWGTGQTPIKEVLQLLKKEKWPIYADIELEYPVPKDSNPVAEVAKCFQYCKEALA